MKPLHVSMVAASCLASAAWGAPHYFDVNGSAPGSGVVAGGLYSATNAVWTRSDAGTTDTILLPTRQGIVFSAGADSFGAAFTVAGSLGQISEGITVQEGQVALTGGGTFFADQTVQTTSTNTGLSISGTSWDFYSRTVTFDVAAGSPATLNAISTTSGRGGSLVKTGPGTLSITGNATARTIGVTVNEGELRLLAANALYNASYPPPNNSYTVTVGTSGTLALAGGIGVTNNPVTLAGTLAARTGTNTFGRLVTLSGAARILADTNTALQLSPASGDAVTGAFPLEIGGAGLVSVTRPITGITALAKTGTGTATLSASNAFGGASQILGGTLRLAEAGGVPASTAGPFEIAGTLEISNTSPQTWTNTLAGPATGLVVKSGTGTLTLASSNDFTGTVRVASGRFALDAGASLAQASQIHVATNAVFDVAAVSGFTLSNAQTLSGLGSVAGAFSAGAGSLVEPGVAGTNGALTFSAQLALAGATAAFDLATTPSGQGDTLQVQGDMVLAGTNVFRVAYDTLANGAYPLVRTTGSVTGDLGGLRLEGFITGAQVAAITILPGGNGLDLVVSSNSHTARDLAWAGGGGNVWQNTGDPVWRVDGAPAVFTAPDRVRFDAAGAANHLITIAGEVAPESVTVDADYTFAGTGSIIGSAALVKSGGGQLTVSNSNAFTGGTLVNAGTIRIAATSSLGAGPVTNNASIVLAPEGAITLANAIGGTGALAHSSGTTLVTGSNSFTGAVTVGGGTLRAGNPSALGSDTQGTTIQAGGVLDLNGVALGSEPVALAGGTLANNAAGPAALAGPLAITTPSAITAHGTLTISGALSGSAPLSITGPVVFTGPGNYSGTLTVPSGAVLTLSGTGMAGSVTVDSGGALGGSGTLGGSATVNGILGDNPVPSTLAIGGNLTLGATSETRLQIAKSGGTITADRINVTGTAQLGGGLAISISGTPLAAGDTITIVASANFFGSFADVRLPYLHGDLIWDTSSLSSGILRVIALPAVSTQEQRRLWLLTRAAETPSAFDGWIMAAAYFARGEDDAGRALALTRSRSQLAKIQTDPVQVDLFDMWPAADLVVRHGGKLDAETKDNIRQFTTIFTQYKDTVTSNLRTLAWVTRYLAGQAFGEQAFTDAGVANYWRADDPNAARELSNQVAGFVVNGFGEHASRPYYWKNLLPFLSIAQLSNDPALRQRAALGFEAGLAQNAGAWLRGHLGDATSRNYPDVLNQFPVTSLGMLWFHFGGDIPPTTTESALMAGTMNQSVSPLLEEAASSRSTSFATRGLFGGAHRSGWVDRDYILFSDGPTSFGNFQVYPNGVVWTDPDLSRYSFLWVAKPWRDDAGINVSNPHGRNTAYYKEAQARDCVLYIYNIPASGDAFPYALGYVPGGYRAALNEASANGHIFLHYGTVMIAIRSENAFTWNPGSGISFPAATPAPGDSEFRISGTQFAVAIETARPSDFSGTDPAAQLAAFRTAVMARPGPARTEAATPTAIYTTRRGDTLEVALSKEPATRPVSLNGAPVNFNNWPVLESPWIFQRAGDRLLTLEGSGRRELLDFTAWSRSVQNAALVSPPAAPPKAGAGRSVDVDLAALTSLPAGHAGPAAFDLGSASAGDVILLSDGRTARFTASAAASGTGAFSFKALAPGVDPRQLVLLYNFEPPENLSDNIIGDRSGHRLDGTLTGVGSPVRELITSTPPALGTASTQALRFVESGGNATRITRLLTVAEQDLSDADWTFATWVRRNSTDTPDFIFYTGSGDGFGGNGDELYLHFEEASDSLRLCHYNASNVLDVDLRTTATSGVWHHVAATFTRTGLNTGVLRLYLDGILKETSPPVTWSINQTSPVVFGGCASGTGAGPTRHLDGDLDDIVLFRSALDPARIARLARMSVDQSTGLSAEGIVTIGILTAIETWRQDHFGTSENAGAAADSADPDADGMPNALEYALGADPLDANSTGRPVLGRDGQRLTLTFLRAQSGLTYIVEAGDDLARWSPLAVNPGTVGSNVTVTDPVEIGTPGVPARFLRLRVTAP